MCVCVCVCAHACGFADLFLLVQFVVFTFWSLYLYDRDLVYPKLLDNFIPQWLNHGMVSTGSSSGPLPVPLHSLLGSRIKSPPGFGLQMLLLVVVWPSLAPGSSVSQRRRRSCTCVCARACAGGGLVPISLL